MVTRPFEEHRLSSYSGESTDWALIGVISLLLLSMNYAPSYGIPFWVPLALTTLAVVLLIWRGRQRRQVLDRAGLPNERRRQLQQGVAIGIAGLIVVGLAIAVAVSGRERISFFTLLPASLAAGVLLYLITASLLRVVPLRFLLIPLAAFISAGLLWTILPGYGYINLFLLSNAVLSLGMAFWLHLGRLKTAHR